MNPVPEPVGDFTIVVRPGHECDPSKEPAAANLPERTRLECMTCGRRWVKLMPYVEDEGTEYVWRPEH